MKFRYGFADKVERKDVVQGSVAMILEQALQMSDLLGPNVSGIDSVDGSGGGGFGGRPWKTRPSSSDDSFLGFLVLACLNMSANESLC